ncbi:Uncharacterized protein dnm_079680 [Desulfonema magnum]|uniref:Uncharacterized protein n=1 Tax=Desulfonema magnum TaxID=45655 RepID=A0A975BUC6_9BACT|nr:Uncharacterized protein dnm_079680 [Desulfonema magnum]
MKLRAFVSSWQKKLATKPQRSKKNFVYEVTIRTYSDEAKFITEKKIVSIAYLSYKI